MDEKDFDKNLDTDMDLDKDFDYDLYEIKYGINLRPGAQDEEPETAEAPGTAEIPPAEPQARPGTRPAARPASRLQSGQKTRPAAQPNKSAGEKGEETAARMELYDWLQCIVSAILCGILIFVFVVRVIGVDGTSMLQTLQDQDKVIMSDLAYTPRYGDIVVIKTETFGDTPIVKRVIATAGQTIDIDFSTGAVMIDDKVIEEGYINTPTTEREDFEGPVTVPQGFVFVMGDNRNASTDSRSDYVGLVDTRQILGKVLFVLIPGEESDGKRLWSRIGSVYR
jgi:signal peptidase I